MQTAQATIADLKPRGLEIDAKQIQAAAASINDYANAAKQAADFVEDAKPIVRDLFGKAVAVSQSLQQKGYFEAAGAGLRVANGLVRSHSADDWRQVEASVPQLIGFLRELTRPEVLQALDEGRPLTRDLRRCNSRRNDRPGGKPRQKLIDKIEALLDLANADPDPGVDVALAQDGDGELELVVRRIAGQPAGIEGATRGAPDMPARAELTACWSPGDRIGMGALEFALALTDFVEDAGKAGVVIRRKVILRSRAKLWSAAVR